MSVKNDQALLIKICQYYYFEGLTQSDIAKRVSLSRPTIVRMLKQAREEGLVEIRLTKPVPKTMTLETEIEKAFMDYGLKEVVVANASGLSPKEDVAKAASDYLRRTLRPNHFLGVGWSTTLSHVASQFTPGQYTPLRIVQLIGAAGKISGANANEIAIKLGDTCRVLVDPMPTPAIVESVEVRDALLRDATMLRTMKATEACNIGLVGVGDVSDLSTMIQADYLTPQDLEYVAEHKGVGDILGQYYDIDGNEVKTPWSERIMGMSLSNLKKVDNVIAVAAEASKVLAVLGALRGGLINTLIIDIPLAEALLEAVNS